MTTQSAADIRSKLDSLVNDKWSRRELVKDIMGEFVQVLSYEDVLRILNDLANEAAANSYSNNNDAAYRAYTRLQISIERGIEYATTHEL